MTVATEKQAKKDKEKEMIGDIRDHLGFLATNLGNVPDEEVSEDYKENMREMIGRLRYYCTHGHWEKGDGPENTPISHIFNMICRKNGGVGKLTGIIAGPRLAGWTRNERQTKDMLKASLIRAVSYTPAPVYQPQWDLPKDDVRNDHPGAVNYRDRLAEKKAEFKRAGHAQLMARKRTKERIETESVERIKTKTKQRKDRKKHFKEQEKKRKGQ